MSINRSMAKGAAWMVSLKLFQRGLGFISTLILARLLVPEDFGLVAMATVMLQLLVAASDFSVHIPLVQKTEIDREDMDSAWSLQLLVGVAQAGILLTLARPAAVFYDEPRLVLIVHVLALIALLRGCKNIGVVMFQRDMTFNRDFTLMATQRLAMFVSTITLAAIYRSYWALVAGMLVGALVELTLSYAMHPHRPRPCRSKWSEIFAFSKWLMLNNLLNFLARRGPEIILGRLVGPRAVGLYSVGFEVSMLATTELVAPINRAVLPGYSRLRETEGGLREGYLDVAGLIALVAVPAAIGIAAMSDLLIPVLLGSRWLDVIPVVHYLALAGGIGALLTNSGTVLLAQGKPWRVSMLLSARLMLLVPGIVYAALEWGVVGVSKAYLAVACIMLVANLSVVLNALSLPILRYINVVYRPVISAGVMYGMLTGGIIPWLTAQAWAPQWIAALLAVLAGAVVYSLSVLCMWQLAGRPDGAERRLLQLALTSMQRSVPALGRWLRMRA